MLDEICMDRRYVNGGLVVPKAEQHLDKRLEKIVDGEIIPRLTRLHRDAPAENVATSAAPPRADLSGHVDEFARLVLRHEADLVIAYVHGLLDDGIPLEALLLDLFAPVARRLGTMWEADQIDFVDVTIGTSRLQQILHHFTLPLEKDASQPGRRVLLLPTPSEQHTFGLLMVSEFFRREGWQVWGGPPLYDDRLRAMVADQWFALIGFSLSSERLIETLCSTIKSVRQFSRNRSVKIIVGGPIFVESEALRVGVGADLAVADAREAVELAESVVSDDLKRQGDRLVR